MKLVQISDLHIAEPGTELDRICRTAERLEEAVAAINAMVPRPDAVVASGDLVDRCLPAEYRRLRDILRPLEPPIYLMVGNHDHRGHLREAFPEHRYLGDGPFVHYVVDDFPVRLIALDSQVTGEVHGALCPERLDWLAARLEEAPEKPTLIVLHHPPFPSGIQSMDANGLIEGREALAALVARHPQVKRLAAGHVHRPLMATVGGVPAQTCPSTAHQLELDFVRTDGVRLLAEPPACLLHCYDADAGLVTHQCYIGEYPLLADVKLA